MASNRLQKEMMEMKSVEACDGVRAAPKDEKNLAFWEAEIVGPDDTPYSGGHYLVELRFGKSYPFVPPQVLWKSKIYHPNISSKGFVCVDLLKTDNWTPAITIKALLISLRSLLSEPNPEDPLVASIAEEYKNKRHDFIRKAEKWTAHFASKERKHECKFEKENA